jgi:hypothetical protein
MDVGKRWQGRLVAIGISTAVAVSLLTAAVALAGTKTITVNDKDHKLPRCYDIEKVVANARTKTTTFTITMAENAKAKPCGGFAKPDITINNRCSVSGSSVTCEGGGGGSAKTRISKSNPRDFVVSFATNEARLSGTKWFKFTVSMAEGQDSAGPASVKIG